MFKFWRIYFYIEHTVKDAVLSTPLRIFFGSYTLILLSMSLSEAALKFYFMNVFRGCEFKSVSSTLKTQHLFLESLWLTPVFCWNTSWRNSLHASLKSVLLPCGWVLIFFLGSRLPLALCHKGVTKRSTGRLRGGFWERLGHSAKGSNVPASPSLGLGINRGTLSSQAGAVGWAWVETQQVRWVRPPGASPSSLGDRFALLSSAGSEVSLEALV